MNNTRKVVVAVIAMFFTFTVGCKTSIQEQQDVYEIIGNIVNEVDSTYYEKAGLEVMLLNYENKSISKFQISFQLLNEEGIPFDVGVYEIVGHVDPKGLAKIILNLDESFKMHDPAICFVDYLFVNKIIYEDGSEYNDPYGLVYFSNLED